MSTVRLRRLTADFENLSNYVRNHPRLRLIQSDGDPPERYQLEYRVKSLRKRDDELTVVKKHLVELILPRNYPRNPPQCRMLSPVFHPNIAPHAICVGDHWSAGESLESIVIRIGEMLAYQVYNVKSPLNGEAARWVQQHEDELPLDEVSMLVEEIRGESPDAGLVPPIAAKTAPAAARAKSAVPRRATSKQSPAEDVETVTTDRIVVSCGACGKRYRVPATLAGRKFKCQNCGAILSIEIPV